MKNTNNVPSVEEVEVVETPVEETPKKAPKKTPKKGVVANCRMLNIREKADKTADVVTVVTKGTELEVYAKEIDGWYSVRTDDGVRGFCMKDYVTILQ